MRSRCQPHDRAIDLWIVGLLIGGVGVAVPAPMARADDGATFELDWVAPAGCPGGDYIRAQVERNVRSGQGRSAGGSTIVHARPQFEPADGLWHARLQIERGGRVRERDFAAESCGALAEATAVMVTLMLDPSGGDDNDETPARNEPAPAPAAPASAAPTPVLPSRAPPLQVAPDAPAPAPPDGSSKQPTTEQKLRISVAGMANAGALPRVAPGLRVGAGWTAGAVRVDAGAFVLAANRRYVADSSAGGDVELASGFADTCVLRSGSRLTLGPCAGVEVGSMSASGVGSTRTGHNRGLWAAVTGGGLVTFGLGPWLDVPLRIDLVVPLSRPVFTITGLGQVYTPAAIGAEVGGGLELRIW
jgi:hypothetical protein